jgi:putative acetyltransferase
VRCRDAAAADIPWLTETACAAYRTVFAPVLPGADLGGFDAAYFTARFAEAWPRTRIAETAEGQAAGFHLTTDAHIDMFFVAEEARGQGIGAFLLADAEARGARSLECFAANAGARRFYARAGWREAAAYERLFAGRPERFVRFER